MKHIMFSKRKMAGVLNNTIKTTFYATISKSLYSNYKLTSQQREAINWDHLQNVSLQNVSFTKRFPTKCFIYKTFPPKCFVLKNVSRHKMCPRITFPLQKLD